MQKRIWMTGVMLLILTLTTGSVFAAESAHTKEEVVRASVKEAGKETVDAAKATAEAYTYRYAENGEENYRTVLVLQLNNVSVTEDDEITVAVNDYLNPFSPQDGVEYTRKTSDDLWSGEHAVTVMPKDLQTEVLLGSELKNGAKSRLICMSFPSSGNAERESEMPEYVITVMSSPRTVTVPVWVVIPAGLVIALIVVFVRKKRAA